MRCVHLFLYDHYNMQEKNNQIKEIGLISQKKAFLAIFYKSKSYRRQNRKNTLESENGAYATGSELVC